MKKQNVSDAVIRRLPRYYRYLQDLHLKGTVRISSSILGEKMGITASQIRQDLSCFGEFGQQGYGYNVEELRAEIGHILGVDESHRVIVVGRELAGVPVLDMSELERFVAAHRPHVAVLTVPQAVAQRTADRLIDLGIRGFWNFTNVELTSSVPNVRFEDVHFADSLLTLSYRITER